MWFQNRRAKWRKSERFSHGQTPEDGTPDQQRSSEGCEGGEQQEASGEEDVLLDPETIDPESGDGQEEEHHLCESGIERNNNNTHTISSDSQHPYTVTTTATEVMTDETGSTIDRINDTVKLDDENGDCSSSDAIKTSLEEKETGDAVPSSSFKVETEPSDSQNMATTQGEQLQMANVDDAAEAKTPVMAQSMSNNVNSSSAVEPSSRASPANSVSSSTSPVVSPSADSHRPRPASREHPMVHFTNPLHIPPGGGFPHGGLGTGGPAAYMPASLLTHGSLGMAGLASRPFFGLHDTQASARLANHGFAGHLPM